MEKTVVTSILLGSFLLLSGCNETVPSMNTKEVGVAVKYVDNPAIQAKGMKQIKGLVAGVKPALMETFKKDKTGVAGMAMCSKSAQKMGKNYNATLPKDSKVRRTAIKYRNPKNKPDATDLTVMKRLIADNKFKKPLVVEMKDHYRVYKALPMHKPCLACHGDVAKMPEKMKKIISKKYPDDLATGLKEHEFRGVIVSEIKKEK